MTFTTPEIYLYAPPPVKHNSMPYVFHAAGLNLALGPWPVLFSSSSDSMGCARVPSDHNRCQRQSVQRCLLECVAWCSPSANATPCPLDASAAVLGSRAD